MNKYCEKCDIILLKGGRQIIIRRILSLAFVLLVLLLPSGESDIKEVNASTKTKCILTQDGGFFCEGNPGYEAALANFNN